LLPKSNQIKSNQIKSSIMRTNQTQTTENALTPATLDFGGLPDFTGDEYVDRKARAPKITALRGEAMMANGEYCFGLFVKIEDAIDAELSIPEGMDPTSYTHGDGEKSEGYMFGRDFGMCVIPLSPLLAFPKSKDPQNPWGPVEYNASTHKGNPDYVAGRVYDVLLVKDGTLLNTRPFRMTLKGASSATFAKAWEAERIATGKLYSAAKGRPYRPMNFQFNRLVVFWPVMARELAGDAQKSPALIFKVAENPRGLADRLMMAQHEIVASALTPLAPQGEQSMLTEAADDMPF
jgi:hypothetical protein